MSEKNDLGEQYIAPGTSEVATAMPNLIPAKNEDFAQLATRWGVTEEIATSLATKADLIATIFDTVVPAISRGENSDDLRTNFVSALLSDISMMRSGDIAVILEIFDTAVASVNNVTSKVDLSQEVKAWQEAKKKAALSINDTDSGLDTHQ